MAKIGEIVVRITADTRQFDRAMRRMTRVTRRTNRAMRQSPFHRRSLRLRGARSTAAWATCYVYVTTIPRALRAYAPSAIRWFFIWSGVLFWTLMAIFTYGHFA